jgi:hypothetical protein
MMRRIARSLFLFIALLAMTLAVLAQTFNQLPTPTTLSAMQAAMQANAVLSPEYQGNPITLDVGDITPGNALWVTATDPVANGSYTDSSGNVWTLPFMPGGKSGCQTPCPFGQVDLNGRLLQVNAEFTAAVILINNVLYAEGAKGSGWYYWNGSTFVSTTDPHRKGTIHPGQRRDRR